MAGCRTDAAAAPAQIAAEIEETLHASARAWNAGDLDSFLNDYLDSPATTFAGASGVVRGTQEIRSRYERTYWAPGAARDSLSFEILEVRPLGVGHALAVGRYVLHDPARGATTGGGYFSLVLERTAGGWKIIHDHTSATATPSPTDTP